VSALRQRIISGTLLAAALTALMLLDGWLSSRPAPQWRIGSVNLGHWLCNGAVCTLLLLILSALAAAEVTRLVRRLGYYPNRAVVQSFAAGLVLGPYLWFNLRQEADWYDESWGMLWVAIGLGLAFLIQAVRRGTQHATLNVAAALFVIVYTGGLAGYMTRLRMEVGGWQGVTLLLFSVFLVKMADVGAFFAGVRLGRHKLIPWLSPNKTWEGFVGGVATTVFCAYAVGSYLHGAGLARLPDGPLAYPWGLVWFGLLMALFSAAGDLAASLLKRDAQVKDSGALIPGMGGVLDMLDSPLLAAPVAWFFWTRLVR